MNEQPTISIVIAVYNGAQTLARCLDSVFAQTYPHIDVVVMDGGSSDGTLAVIQQYQSQINYWVSERDAGIYNAWNKSLSHIKGDWVYFLGCDDVFHDATVLASMASHLKQAQQDELRVVYGSVNVVRDSGELIETRGRDWSATQMAFRTQAMAIPHQGCFHARQLFEDYGGFDESLRISADYEFLLRELKDKDALFVPDVIIADMQWGGVSSTLKGVIQVTEEECAARAKQGLPSASASTRMKLVVLKLLLRLLPLLGEQRVYRMLDAYLQFKGKPRRWAG